MKLQQGDMDQSKPLQGCKDLPASLLLLPYTTIQFTPALKQGDTTVHIFLLLWLVRENH